MIKSWADKATEHLYHGTDSKPARAFDRAIWSVIARKLDLVNAAHSIQDLRAPPGNKLHALKGAQKGRYAIRVNDQFRLTVRFAEGDAYDVRCEDYHR